MSKKKSSSGGLVFSTNPDFLPGGEDEFLEETPAPNQQDLRVMHDRKQRNGKTVTIVKGFIGHPDDLKELGKLLKNKCGVGGTTKDGEILIQGEFADKILQILLNEGYKVKKSGG